MAKIIGRRVFPGGKIEFKNDTDPLFPKERDTPLLLDKIKSVKFPLAFDVDNKKSNYDISVSSVGSGFSVIKETSARELIHRLIHHNGVVKLSYHDDSIRISAARATLETSSLGGVSLGLTVSAGTGNRNELRIRGLTGGGIIEVSSLTNSIVISAAPPGSLTQNITNSAFGGGINPILAISGNSEIQTRTFVGGGIIEVSAASNGRIIVSATQNITNSAFGGGINPILAISGNSEIQTRTFVGGGIIEVSAASNGRIIVSATQNVTLSSFGGGATLAIGVSANREIQLRTLTGAGIAEVTTVGNTVQISAARATLETSSLGGVSLGLAVSAGTGNRNELRIRGLTGGGIIEVSSLTNSIVISAAPVSFTQNITNSAFGGGINPVLAISGNREIQTRTFVGGGIIEVSAASDGRIIVSADSGGSLSVTLSGYNPTLPEVLAEVSSNEIAQRPITGAGNISVYINSSEEIVVNDGLVLSANLNGVSAIFFDASEYDEYEIIISDAQTNITSNYIHGYYVLTPSSAYLSPVDPEDAEYEMDGDYIINRFSGWIGSSAVPTLGFQENTFLKLLPDTVIVSSDRSFNSKIHIYNNRYPDSGILVKSISQGIFSDFATSSLFTYPSIIEGYHTFNISNYKHKNNYFRFGISLSAPSGSLFTSGVIRVYGKNRNYLLL